MKSKKLLLLGCGDLGTALGWQMNSAGYDISAVRRNVAKVPAAFSAFSLDYCDPSQQQRLRALATGCAVMTPVPASYDAAGYQAGYVDAVRNLLAAWQQLPSQQILFVSSTRVYGDCGGDWVDEDSTLDLSGYAAAAIHAAEQLLMDSHHQVTVIRFAGIYGRLPSRLLERIARGEVNTDPESPYSNRIHRDDCVGFLAHLLRLVEQGQAPAGLYIGVDDLPCRSSEVETWLAGEMNVEPLSAPPRANRTGNKRCSNRRLRESGYQLIYPDYRSGYAELLQRDTTPP
jgi:nucleoside-diphosphate-sugar epimerase